MIRNRIKDLRWVSPDELRPNKDNWRQHSDEQKKAVQTILDKIGYADTLIAREDDTGQLILIDGHLRAGLDPNVDVPVLVLDVDEDEAKLLLAAIDPTSKMATVDEDALKSLLEDLSVDADQELMEFLASVQVAYDLNSDLPPIDDLDLDGFMGDPYVLVSFKFSPEEFEDKKSVVDQVIELIGKQPTIENIG